MNKLPLILLTCLCASVYGQSELGANGGKIPTKGEAVGGIGADGKFHFLLTGNTGALSISGFPAVGQTTMSTSLPVAIASDQSAVPVSGTVSVPAAATYTAGPTVLQNAATGTGNGTAMTVTGLSSVAIQTTGTYSATITFEVTIDGTNWLGVVGAYTGSVYNYGPNFQASATGQLFKIPVSGYAQFRARISSYVSGSVTVTAMGIADGSVPNVVAWTGGNVTVADGTSKSNFWAPWITPNQGAGAGIPTAALNYNGATMDMVRTPSVFKTATATASGDTALWTPTTGKKFRLMRYQIQITNNAAISGGGVVLDIVLRDATTATAASRSAFIPTAAGTTFAPDNDAWVDLGNGILSSTINNVLNINLSATLTTGKVRVVCAGVEE